MTKMSVGHLSEMRDLDTSTANIIRNTKNHEIEGFFSFSNKIFSESEKQKNSSTLFFFHFQKKYSEKYLLSQFFFQSQKNNF